MGNRRVVVIGLDCLEPSLAFDTLASHMPFLNGQRKKSSGGILRSCTPPITVPAWASMLTGKDPGELGIYGFRNRTRDSYDLHSVDGTNISAPWIWDELQKSGKKTAALFVPGMSPLRSSNALQVACFLHTTGEPWCTGAEDTAILRKTIQDLGEFSPDVPMSENLDDFADGLFASGKYRFDVLQRVIAANEHDFVCFVDLGADRLHHQCFHEGTGFLEGAMAPSLQLAKPDWSLPSPHAARGAPSPLSVSGALAAQLLADYYGFLDVQLQRLLRLAETHDRETVFFVASDHGAQPIDSAFFVNAWLEQHGFLVMHPGSSEGPLRANEVDFAKTQAWAEGGYYGRIMLNMEGREPHGIVPPNDAENVLARIRVALEYEGTTSGHRMQLQTASELYREVHGLPPDLFLSVDDYGGRVLSSFHGEPHKLWGGYDDVLQEPGRHGCNHAMHGLAVAYSTDSKTKLAAPQELAKVHEWLHALVARE